MIDSKEGIVANPLKLTCLVVIGMYIIFAFFNPVIILQLLAIIVVIFIFSFALITIFYYLSPILLSFSRRVTNILPSIIFVMLTSATISNNTPRPIFKTEVINILLIFTLITIGCIYIGFALINTGFVLINTGFPKWHRQINILIGSFSIILSLITMMVSILGFTFLIIVICALIAIDKINLFLKEKDNA